MEPLTQKLEHKTTAITTYHDNGEILYNGEISNMEKCGFGKQYYTNGCLQISCQWLNSLPYNSIRQYHFPNNKLSR